jgi:hypothetical protein
MGEIRISNHDGLSELVSTIDDAAELAGQMRMHGNLVFPSTTGGGWLVLNPGTLNTVRIADSEPPSGQVH